MEEKIEIKNDIKIIDYSKGNSDLHIKFQWKGEEDDPNDDSQFNGGHMEFKFKDPRDALKELVKNWKLYDKEISLKLLDYVNYGISRGNFNPLQVYYNIILNFQILYTIEYSRHNWPLPEIKEGMSKEDEDLYHKLINGQLHRFSGISRISHKWAVANTWWYYNYYKKTLNNGEEGIPNNLSLFDENFCFEYKGKKVMEVTGFLLSERLWKVRFEDGSWVIGYDAGNGWYKPITDFNSYKINLPYRR